MDIIVAEVFKGLISEDHIKEISTIFEKGMKLTEIDYSIVFESDIFVQSLNDQYRGINSPTDVLSFEANVVDPFTQKKYLGDVVISVPTLLNQAEEREIEFRDEVSVIVIHGLLHLIGMDHTTTQRKKDMWTIQQQLLQALNVASAAYPQ